MTKASLRLVILINGAIEEVNLFLICGIDYFKPLAVKLRIRSAFKPGADANISMGYFAFIFWD